MSNGGIHAHSFKKNSAVLIENCAIEGFPVKNKGTFFYRTDLSANNYSAGNKHKAWKIWQKE